MGPFRTKEQQEEMKKKRPGLYKKWDKIKRNKIQRVKNTMKNRTQKK